MPKLSYKGRIHRQKFSARSLRYIAADQLARTFPALQRRWMFPVEAVPIAEAASGCQRFDTVTVDGELPPELVHLFPGRKLPIQIAQNVFTLRDVTVTGQAGAMMRGGKLLAVRGHHNWAISLRPRPFRERQLSPDRTYYNLISPVPARGHIFHWLFDFVLPLITWLEMRSGGEPLTLLVNAERLAFQNLTLDALLALYPCLALEPVGEAEAVTTPHLIASVFTPHKPRALQTPAALARLSTLAETIAAREPSATPRRFFISREDAKLRRVLNESEVLARLEPAGFERVILKGMPPARQVKLFRDAEAVFSPHGAGLAHIAWCKPGTSIMEVFPSPDGPRGRPRNATDNFWLISTMRQLKYRVAFGGPTLNSRDGFEIPVSCFEPALSDLAD